MWVVRSMTVYRKRLEVLKAAVVGFVLAMGSQASADIVISNPVAGSPATPGNGLLADYYKVNFLPENLANAQNYIDSNAPDSTFISTGVGYPYANPGSSVGDGTSLSTYLGNDAASLSNPSVGGNSLDQSIYNFTGFINITAANLTTTFSLGSDDGSELSINGTQVIDNDGDHGFNTISQTVDFTAPGLYAVNLLYFEDEGVTAVLLSSTIGAPQGGPVEVPESVLYQGANAVPEPSSLLLLGVGASLMVGVGCRRVRSRSVPARTE